MARIKILKTEKEYDKACERIYHIIHSNDDAIEPDTKEGEELELLSLLIENYEKENHALGVPNPIEAIKFRMDQMNLKQIDVERESKSGQIISTCQKLPIGRKKRIGR